MSCACVVHTVTTRGLEPLSRWYVFQILKQYDCLISANIFQVKFTDAIRKANSEPTYSFIYISRICFDRAYDLKEYFIYSRTWHRIYSSSDVMLWSRKFVSVWSWWRKFTEICVRFSWSMRWRDSFRSNPDGDCS